MKITITANEKGKPPLYGPIAQNTWKKIADIELRFEEDEPLAGYVLSGFVLWQNLKDRDQLAITPPSWTLISPRGTETVSLLTPMGERSGNITLKGELLHQILETYRLEYERTSAN